MALLATRPCAAQLIDRYFPEGVPGYGTEQGVTVQSRARTATDPLGVRVGPLLLRPALTSAIGVTDNAQGRAGGGKGSLLVSNGISLLAGTQWGRNAVGAFAAVDDQQVLADARQSATAWSAALGGTLELGRSQATLAASHIDFFQTSRALDGLAIDRPGRAQAENVRSTVRVPFGRLTLVPGLSVTTTRYDDVFVAGRRVVQRYRDRLALEGNLAARWELAPQRDLVLDLRATGFDHARSEPGQPSRDATTIAMLAGFDSGSAGVWRVRALAGWQQRHFAAPSLGTVTAPIVEVQAIWTPTGLTTLTGTVSRRIEDAAELAAVSYTFTQLRLVADHELRRDLLLRAYVDLQQADYQQGGGQARFINAGLAATWLANRRVRVQASYDYGTRRPSAGLPVNEGVALLRLRFAL